MKIKQNCCKSGSFLMIADPLWSCVMLLCGPLCVLCGRLRYLVIPVAVALVSTLLTYLTDNYLWKAKRRDVVDVNKNVVGKVVIVMFAQCSS